jgi:hypothetical protein
MLVPAGICGAHWGRRRCGLRRPDGDGIAVPRALLCSRVAPGLRVFARPRHRRRPGGDGCAHYTDTIMGRPRLAAAGLAVCWLLHRRGRALTARVPRGGRFVWTGAPPVHATLTGVALGF